MRKLRIERSDLRLYLLDRHSEGLGDVRRDLLHRGRAVAEPEHDGGGRVQVMQVGRLLVVDDGLAVELTRGEIGPDLRP